MKKVIIIMSTIVCLFSLGVVLLFNNRQSKLPGSPIINNKIQAENLHINEEGKLNINTATVQELTVLDGIGEVLAQRIVEYRDTNGPFKDISDLLNIKGIGQAKLNGIKDQICIN